MRSLFSTLSLSVIVPNINIFFPLMDEVSVILFSLTQCPVYKQLFIVTYCNQRVMGPHKSFKDFYSLPWVDAKGPTKVKQDQVSRVVSDKVKDVICLIHLVWFMTLNMSLYCLVNDAGGNRLFAETQKTLQNILGFISKLGQN